jgi:GTP cyclohydrolase III
MKGLLFLLSLSLVGCGGLTTDEASVRVLRNSDAPKDCQEAGRVTASGKGSASDEEREDDLKKETHKLGGNTVVITKKDENNIYGIAFKCP